MDDETKTAIEAIRAQMFALRTLVLSHIAAVSVTEAELTAATIEIANTQLDAAVAKGMGREAAALGSLLGALAELTGPLAAND